MESHKIVIALKQLASCLEKSIWLFKKKKKVTNFKLFLKLWIETSYNQGEK